MISEKPIISLVIRYFNGSEEGMPDFISGNRTLFLDYLQSFPAKYSTRGCQKTAHTTRAVCIKTWVDLHALLYHDKFVTCLENIEQRTSKINRTAANYHWYIREVRKDI